VHEHKIRRLDAENLSLQAGLRPTSPDSASRRHGLVLGFDTEWEGSTKELLSIQLAAVVGEGAVGSVFDAPASKLTTTALVDIVARFVDKLAMRPPTGRIKVYLVAHFAGAELGMLEDALRDAAIKTIGKAHFATFPKIRHDGRDWEVRIVDLFAIYNMALQKVGDAVGLPKVQLPEGAIENLKELRSRDPALFERYAKRDAEIAVLAMERLRNELLERWEVDPLAFPTIASIAVAIFRRHHFSARGAVPFHFERQAYRDGGRKQVAVVDKKLLRRLALQAYWGGRNEAYVRGLYRGPVVDLSVASACDGRLALILTPCSGSDGPGRETFKRTPREPFAER
jgi:hypothetical protein